MTKSPVIDFHGHFFPDEIAEHAVATVAEISQGYIKPVLDGKVSTLQNAMQSHGVDYTVTIPVATKPEQVASINANLPLNKKGIIPFGAVHPLTENITETVELLLQNGIQGIKMHPEYQNFYIDDIAYEHLFKTLNEAGMIVLIHAGWDPGPFNGEHASPKRIANLLEREPGIKLVAAHMGGLMMWDEVEEHLVGKPLWLDTSATAGHISREQFERICRNHGFDRILYGSDTPWEGQVESLQFIKNCSFTEKEKSMILGENAAALLELAL